MPHLEYLPYETRVSAIQAAIQTWGPIPDDLGAKARELLSPNFKMKESS